MEVPRHWRLRKARYRLVGEECPHCQVKIFPPRYVCPECGGGTLRGNLDMQIGTFNKEFQRQTSYEPLVTRD